MNQGSGFAQFMPLGVGLALVAGRPAFPALHSALESSPDIYQESVWCPTLGTG